MVVGGPDAMSSPDIFAAADFQVLGEAEELIDEFVAAWAAGPSRASSKREIPGRRHQEPGGALRPAPSLNDYLYLRIQFSRGCPFSCDSATSSSSTDGCRGRRPTSRCSPSSMLSTDRLSRPRRLRRRQPDRQQEGAQAFCPNSSTGSASTAIRSSFRQKPRSISPMMRNF